jgi:hypothetical protein
MLAALILPSVSPITGTATPPHTTVWRPPSTAPERAAVCRTARACGAGSRHWMAPVSVSVSHSSTTVACVTLTPATTTRAARQTTRTGVRLGRMAPMVRLWSALSIQYTGTATPPATHGGGHPLPKCLRLRARLRRSMGRTDGTGQQRPMPRVPHRLPTMCARLRGCMAVAPAVAHHALCPGGRIE